MDFGIDSNIRFRRYYVLFRKARLRAWWSVFTTVSDFGHCSILEAIEYTDNGLARFDYCLHTDYCFGILDQRIYWDSAPKLISKALTNRSITAVAVVDVEKKHKWGYIPFGLFTCVTLVKWLLGIHDWRIQTPQGLMRYLEDHDATVVWRC